VILLGTGLCGNENEAIDIKSTCLLPTLLLNNGNALRDMLKSEDLTVTILSSSRGHGMQ